MLSALLVASFDLAILVVVALRAREVLFVTPLGLDAVKVASRTGAAGLAALGSEGAPSAASEIARAATEAEQGDHAIAVEDAVAQVREGLVRRLMVLRIMAPAASALGLAGAAVQAGWARHPPGLLALDPDRVFGMAATDGATCLALGIAGSTSALGALFFLRRRALATLDGANRVADRARALPADAWTRIGR